MYNWLCANMTVGPAIIVDTRSSLMLLSQKIFQMLQSSIIQNDFPLFLPLFFTFIILFMLNQILNGWTTCFCCRLFWQTLFEWRTLIMSIMTSYLYGHSACRSSLRMMNVHYGRLFEKAKCSCRWKQFQNCAYRFKPLRQFRVLIYYFTQEKLAIFRKVYIFSVK